jgi:hypothetical protein
LQLKRRAHKKKKKHLLPRVVLVFASVSGTTREHANRLKQVLDRVGYDVSLVDGKSL